MCVCVRARAASVRQRCVAVCWWVGGGWADGPMCIVYPAASVASVGNLKRGRRRPVGLFAGTPGLSRTFPTVIAIMIMLIGNL